MPKTPTPPEAIAGQEFIADDFNSLITTLESQNPDSFELGNFEGMKYIAHYADKHRLPVHEVSQRVVTSYINRIKLLAHTDHSEAARRLNLVFDAMFLSGSPTFSTIYP